MILLTLLLVCLTNTSAANRSFLTTANSIMERSLVLATDLTFLVPALITIVALMISIWCVLRTDRSYSTPPLPTSVPTHEPEPVTFCLLTSEEAVVPVRLHDLDVAKRALAVHLDWLMDSEDERQTSPDVNFLRFLSFPWEARQNFLHLLVPTMQELLARPPSKLCPGPIGALMRNVAEDPLWSRVQQYLAIPGRFDEAADIVAVPGSIADALLGPLYRVRVRVRTVSISQQTSVLAVNIIRRIYSVRQDGGPHVRSIDVRQESRPIEFHIDGVGSNSDAYHVRTSSGRSCSTNITLSLNVVRAIEEQARSSPNGYVSPVPQFQAISHLPDEVSRQMIRTQLLHLLLKAREQQAQQH